jgi:CubicO group peptidase (beta-lactamase class C family)
MQTSDQIDAALRQAVASGDVPGVVAMAASGEGVVYAGAFGVRDLAAGTAMTGDTVFRIASMTKMVTAIAALQLVEQGRLALDAPVPDIDPALSAPRVLEGFDAAGAPRLRPARGKITLRHLLTHTAGFSYEAWDADTLRYVAASGMPSASTGKLAALRLPLAFDPGTRWEYGLNMDWVGQIVEAVSGQALDAYVSEHITMPLGMADTGFIAAPAQRARQASVHQRAADGTLAPLALEAPFSEEHRPEFWAGGAGLYSTAADYLTLLRMLLHGGSFEGARILREETVAEMARNQIGDLAAGILKTTTPARSNDVDLFPGSALRWGLGPMINMAAGPHGRSAGTLTWGGVFNSYFWLDPARQIAGVMMTQILPFADARALRLYGRFESGVYGATTSS